MIRQRNAIGMAFRWWTYDGAIFQGSAVPPVPPLDPHMRQIYFATTGEEEKQYWDKLTSDREKKLNTKSRSRKRGHEKASIMMTGNMLNNLSRSMRFPTILHFDKCRLGRASAAYC